MIEEKIKNLLGAAIVFGIVSAVFIGFWYVKSFSSSIYPQRSFQVQGEGKAVAVPDVAQLSFGVLTEGGINISDLQEENSQKTNSIISFLKERSIEDKDIKTQSYSINPRYQYYSCPPEILREGSAVSPCPPPKIVGYSISQTVSVKIRDFNKIGEVLAGVVGRGANNVSGPAFTIDDPDKLQQQAREEAITKAKEKARTMAKAGGFQLGKLLSINEGGFLPSPIPFEGAYGGTVLKESITPTIEPGSQEIRVNVNLIYEIR